jgi:hypothetical protein
MRNILDQLYKEFKAATLITAKKRTAYARALKDFDACQDELFNMAEKGSACEMTRLYEGYKAANESLTVCADELIAANNAEHAAWEKYSEQEMKNIILGQEEFKADYANWFETSKKIEALFAEQEA